MERKLNKIFMQALCKNGHTFTYDRNDIVGAHAVLCGDSTKREDVERLMGEEKASIAFTSPPYNLGVSAHLRGNTKVGNRGNAYALYDDNQNEDDWLDLMKKSTENMLDFSDYVFVNVQSLAGNRTALPRWWAHFAEQFCDVAIWDKGHAAPAAAQRVMNSVFEFIFVFTRENPNRAIRSAPEFRGTISNVYAAPPQRNNDDADVHGATFPIHLPHHFISTFSQKECIVLEPFGGSGTTLIACEQSGRHARLLEIDPRYVDVTISRYCALTGAKTVIRNGEVIPWP